MEQPRNWRKLRVAEALQQDPGEWICLQQQIGRTLPDITAELTTRSGISVGVEAIRVWRRHYVERLFQEQPSE